jgi:hypothetical protein
MKYWTYALTLAEQTEMRLHIGRNEDCDKWWIGGWCKII